jgi:hypothetical protein
MKNLYSKWLWVKWRLNWSTLSCTCLFLSAQKDKGYFYDYRRFLEKEMPAVESFFWGRFSLIDYYESKERTHDHFTPLVKAMDKRRELMWRFLWKGERA